MATTQEEVCGHDLAAPLSQSELPAGYEDRLGTILGCGDCGTYIDVDNGDENDDLNTLLGIGESHAGKASRPRRAGKGKPYRRSEEHLVTVTCSQPKCGRKWKMWKQNVGAENLCPDLHRPLRKQELGRQRQRTFRESKKTR